MTPLQGLVLLAGAYLILLARSAWKQGELRQFLVSLATVAALLAVLAGVVWGYIYLDTH